MGLYDREYVREDEDYRPSGGGLSAQSITMLLIIANVVVYLADAIFTPDHWLMDHLAIDPASLAKPWMWWQFITAGFAHDPDNVWHIAGNMFMLYMFGRLVEQVLGRREFFRFYMAALVLGNVLFALRQYFFIDPTVVLVKGQQVLIWAHALGASGAVTAVFVLFVCYFPKQTLLLFFVIPVPAWLLGAVLIGLDVLGSLGTKVVPGEPMVAHDVHLTGAAFAFLYWRFQWRLDRYLRMDGLKQKLSNFTKPKLKVHKPEPSYEDQDAEADRLLDKVHRDGEQSLTARERRILEDYARRMRQKLR